jgi:hypothetical protein
METNAVMLQVGRGPFAPPATGLVKIGEPMTLVVTVEGDAGFDVSVGECVAHAGDRDKGGPIVKLTDVDGCPLKTKFFPEPFKTTRETGRSGASIIAYAFFQAFKFPDQMELFIECEVELCKTGCRVCPRFGVRYTYIVEMRIHIFKIISLCSKIIVANVPAMKRSSSTLSVLLTPFG